MFRKVTLFDPAITEEQFQEELKSGDATYLLAAHSIMYQRHHNLKAIINMYGYHKKSLNDTTHAAEIADLDNVVAAESQNLVVLKSRCEQLSAAYDKKRRETNAAVLATYQRKIAAYAAIPDHDPLLLQLAKQIEQTFNYSWNTNAIYIAAGNVLENNNPENRAELARLGHYYEQGPDKNGVRAGIIALMVGVATLVAGAALIATGVGVVPGAFLLIVSGVALSIGITALWYSQSRRTPGTLLLQNFHLHAKKLEALAPTPVVPSRTLV